MSTHMNLRLEANASQPAGLDTGFSDNVFWPRATSLCSGQPEQSEQSGQPGQPGQSGQPSPYWKLSEGEGAVWWTISTKWHQIKCCRMIHRYHRKHGGR